MVEIVAGRWVVQGSKLEGDQKNMDANKDTATDGSEKINRNSDVAPVAGNAADEGEFKIEIRKLEVPVRPRGVLAE